MSGEETCVEGYVLTGGADVYLLLDPDTRDPRATIVSLGNGTWRARTLDGKAKTFEPPDEIDRPALWVAEQLTMEAPDGG
ncbi:hypothetical protein AGRA3207_003814 [Actinomadura graeca]|uniref:Uncharacterized protein n=1 Tax=Actinomadura graeca TaxID=2750812 RepID=A0ABX8QVW0_9ACTN|nr:hypothetical protein [Actinomadura graeca]QXJ22758.1 hypothetical protein AGRA3207_003814 [Actinomadura graeca]